MWLLYDRSEPDLVFRKMIYGEAYCEAISDRRPRRGRRKMVLNGKGGLNVVFSSPFASLCTTVVSGVLVVNKKVGLTTDSARVKRHAHNDDGNCPI